MKYLITLSVLVLICLQASAQSQAMPTDTTVYGNVESNFPGGQKAYNTYIQNGTRYPGVALENKIQGCSYVKLTIEKDSLLSSVTTYSGIGSGMDEEAVRAIKASGKWIPARINGANIRTNCIATVRFTLNVNNDNNLIGVVDGNPSDTSYLSKIIAFESSGVPVTEISKYPHQKIKFVGEVYDTKAASDTVFILTCGQNNYTTKYANVVLMGKDAQVEYPKKKISGYLIKGEGTVVNYNGTFIIIIEDKKKYSLIPEFHPTK